MFNKRQNVKPKEEISLCEISGIDQLSAQVPIFANLLYEKWYLLVLISILSIISILYMFCQVCVCLFMSFGSLVEKSTGQGVKRPGNQPSPQTSFLHL